MLNRRNALIFTARVATLVAAAGLLPAAAQAAYNRALFDSKSLPDLAKALGGSAPQASKDVSISGPDVAEDGANVPLIVGTTLPGVRRLMSHEMESGQRKDSVGKAVAAWFIQEVAITLNGKPLLNMQCGPAVSKNPFLQFATRNAKVGDKIAVSWKDNRGETRTDEATVA